MKINSKTKSVILDFFRANMARVPLRSEKVPVHVRSLRKAVADGDTGSLWRIWSEVVQERAELLALDEYLAMSFWGDAESGTHKTSDDGVAQWELLDWLRTELNMALDLSVVSPVNWIESLTNMTAMYATLDDLQSLEELRELLTELPTFGEIPLVLGLLYPELTCCRDCLALGRKTLALGLELAVDTQGFPIPERLPLLRPLLACSIRTQILANRTGLKLFSPSTRRLLEWITLEVLRWTRSDGSQVFSSNTKGPTKEDLLLFLDMMETAMRLDDDPNDSTAAITVLSPLAGRLGRTLDIESHFDPILPEPSLISDDSKLAAICSNWSPDSGMAFLDASPLSGSPPETIAMNLEMCNASMTLLAGSWQTKIVLDEKELVPESCWMVSCEEKDERYSCFEWYVDLTGGWKLERLVAMFPRERLLYMADAVFHDSHSKGDSHHLDYQTRLPLHGRTVVDMKHGSRELKLGVRSPGGSKSRKKKAYAQLFPIALNEWRRADESEWLVPEKDAIVLRRHRQGSAIYVPFLFDLDSKRCEGPVTWRSLTVGSCGRKVTEDEAVGFHLRLGREQYLIYRNFGGNEARSVMGQHLIADFYFASFHPTTGIDKIAELETPQ